MQVRDLLFIIIGERRAILQGLTLAFVLVLPFSFLPTIIKHGFTMDAIVARAGVSVMYTSGFALLVVLVSVLYNFKGLTDRRWYFDRPAFRSLYSYGRIDGEENSFRDLETFLLGEVHGYYFRLTLAGTDTENARLEIIPAVHLEEKEEELKILQQHYGFSYHRFFGVVLLLNEIDLEDEDSIHPKLAYYASALKSYGFKPLPVEEFDRA